MLFAVVFITTWPSKLEIHQLIILAWVRILTGNYVTSCFRSAENLDNMWIFRHFMPRFLDKWCWQLWQGEFECFISHCTSYCIFLLIALENGIIVDVCSRQCVSFQSSSGRSFSIITELVSKVLTVLEKEILALLYLFCWSLGNFCSLSYSKMCSKWGYHSRVTSCFATALQIGGVSCTSVKILLVHLFFCTRVKNGYLICKVSVLSEYLL